MLGVFLGAVFAVGAVKLIRRAIWRRRGYGWGSCSPYGAGHFRPRTPQEWLFERLETTPEQERAIVEVAARLRKENSKILDEIGLTRADVARAVEGAVVDESALEETFARHDRLLARLRVAWIEALKSLCETLDERQRKVVADILAKKGFRGPWSLARLRHSRAFGLARVARAYGRDEIGGVWA